MTGGGGASAQVNLLLMTQLYIEARLTIFGLRYCSFQELCNEFRKLLYKDIQKTLSKSALMTGNKCSISCNHSDLCYSIIVACHHIVPEWNN